MIWNDHGRLQGKHAYLSPSSCSWINYDEKFDIVWFNMQNKERGTRYHSLAAELIDLGERLPRAKRALNLYVNDAIGFGMQVEQILYYSDNCFGTADSILFNEKKKILRIHDLKTGETPGSEHQVEIYDALFCLEYGYKPDKIEHELRIYQHDSFKSWVPNPDDIYYLMDLIITRDKRIEKLKIGV